MANISILEQDLTTAGSSSVTANVVYVPGYAIMGPVNEPTLCNTLAEFKKIFGAVPYTWKTAKSLNGKEFATAGDYEKSYLYAAELAKAGLPILFERVGTVDKKASKEIKLNVNSLRTDKNNIKEVKKAHLYKAVSKVIPEKDESLEDEELDNSAKSSVYTYEFNIKDYSLADEPDLTVVPYNSDLSSDSISNVKYEIVEDNETDSESEAKKAYTHVTFDSTSDALESVEVHFNLYNTIYYGVQCTYDTETHTWDNYIVRNTEETRLFTADERFKSDLTIDIEGKDKVFSFTDEFNNRQSGILSAVIEDKLPVIITAKYPGAYGSGISVEVLKNEKSGAVYYDIYVNQVVGSSETSEKHTISLDETNKKYFYKNIEFDLIDIKIPNVDYELVKNNLVDIQEGLFKLKYESDAIEDEFDIDKFYEALRGGYKDEHGEIVSSIFSKLVDRDEYQVKFITSGSYPIYHTNYKDVATTMLKVASNRGDCVALIDHFDLENDKKIDTMFDEFSKFMENKIISDKGEDAKKYGAMFTPWGKYQLNIISGISTFPGSFGYLRCVASSTKTNANWLAVSGVTRGQVPDLLALNSKITGAIADYIQNRQGISINPIMNIKPYGYCIWGNRTLFDNIDDLTASSFLNIRMLTSDVKKTVYSAAKRMTFELNSDVLWLNFKSAIEPTLDQMASGNGISGYKITKIATPKKATIACKIRLYAIEAVEDWDITVELADGYTSVE